MTYIIYEGADGSVAISTLHDDVLESEIPEIVRKFREVHPEGAYPKFSIVESVEAPQSRLFRDAWRKQGQKIIVDENKAKLIHLDRIRQVRNRKLELLDKEQLRYITDSWKPKEIEEQKQILRDLPATFDMSNFDVNNPEWPESLSEFNLLNEQEN